MKKQYKKLLVLPFLFAAVGCEDRAGYYPEYNTPDNYRDLSNIEKDTNKYEEIIENQFVKTSIQNKSSFSLCSSTSAYTNIKSIIEKNSLPDKNAVKIEQMLNYFKYSYKIEDGKDLAIFNEVSDCPWNSQHKLASIAVKAKETEDEDKAKNLVFLIDTSGSMYDEIEMIKKAFTYLTRSITENDRISIVTYSNNVTVVLDGISGDQVSIIDNAVMKLDARGATNGAGGIQKAYEIATKHFITGGINQVILATDGDFNVGIDNTDDLGKFIEEKRDTGVNLSVLGCGSGNFRDDMAETLAKKGNGNAFFIDTENEARKLFEEGLSGIFEVVAKDTKTLVTFDKTTVESYRLLGYENSQMTEEEFNNSKKDAGELLAGDVTVAMYEIELASDADLTKNLFTTEIHYKDPETDESKELKNETAVYSAEKSSDFIFQSMVVEYSLILRGSKYRGTSTYSAIVEMYNSKKDYFDLDNDKAGFIELVSKTQSVDKRSINN